METGTGLRSSPNRSLKGTDFPISNYFLSFEKKSMIVLIEGFIMVPIKPLYDKNDIFNFEN